MTAPGSQALASRASEALLARKEELALAVTDALYDAHPELGPRYGASGRAKCLQDMRHTLEHLAPAVALAEPVLFVRYVDWLVDLLHPRGIPSADVRASVEAVATVLAGRLAPDEYEAASAALHAALAALSARDQT
jgi:hypothetical protein